MGGGKSDQETSAHKNKIIYQNKDSDFSPAEIYKPQSLNGLIQITGYYMHSS